MESGGQSVSKLLLRTTALLGLCGTLVLSACGGSSSGGTPETNYIDITLPAKQGLLPDLKIADDTFQSIHYTGNAVCSGCHNNGDSEESTPMIITDKTGEKDVSIGKAWQTSLMANSTRDPYWHAVVAAELSLYPNLEDEINDTCTVCHAPMANDMAKKEGIELRVFSKGNPDDADYVKGIYDMTAEDSLFNHAMDGVSCSLCHQLADDGNLGTDEGMSGGWTVIQYPEENKADRPAYGQYTDPDQGYMRQQADFNPVYGAHISSSETCGSCHNLKTNPVTKEGLPVEGITHFAEQMVYTEWENSNFDDGGSTPASCQSCHMPKIDQPVLLANAGASVPRDNFAEHTFLGANTVMQEMLKLYKDELGVSESITEADFDESIERNRQFLQTSAELDIINTSTSETELAFDVMITNLTGHKLPSGYHSRRAYLHVRITDENGQQVFESGKMNPDGSIVGVSEDVNPNSYEQHYDTIVSATQVQVYQAITKDSTGDLTHSLLAATGYLKDNRLTPAGFNKNSVPEDVAVVGQAATDNDFNNGFDTVSYRLPLTGSSQYTVAVELRYQPLSYGALLSLFTKSDKIEQVDMFRTMYDSTALKDEVIAGANKLIQ